MSFEVICDTVDREKWLAERRKGIGGSDAPALLGLVSWASPASVQMDKWGLLDEPDDAEILRWGRRLEQAIRQGLAEDEDWNLRPFAKLIRSTTHDFMLCTPDARRSDGMFVQIKNTMLADEWSERVPERVWVQVQHEMAVIGANVCVAAALIFGNRSRWAYVERDDKFIGDVLIPAESEFWQKTQDVEPVASDGSEHTRKAYQTLWPEDSGERVQLDGHFIDLDQEREELKVTEKTTKKRISEIDNEIRLAMKDATYGVLPNHTTYTLKTQHRKEHSVKATSFRALRRSEAKRGATR